MTDDRRVFVDEHPEPGGSGPWGLLAMAAVIVAAAALIISLRDPPTERGVVDLPVPPASSTTTTEPPTTTTTGEPELRLEELVPGFDRMLHLLTFDEVGLTITTWTRGSDPTTVEHPIGRVQWAGFDASGTAVAAITIGSGGRSVLWQGTPDSIEPIRIEQTMLSAVFHTTRPNRLAVAHVVNAETVVSEVAGGTGSDAVLPELVVDGGLTLVSWSNAGFLLADPADSTTLSWIKSDGTVDRLSGLAQPSDGAPLIYSTDFLNRSTLIDDTLETLPGGTISLSPGRTYALVEAPFQDQFVDLTGDLRLPLLDPVGEVVDWSADEAWVVYVSSIDSFQRGVLSRYVFVDTRSGSNVSVSIPEDRLSQPAVLAITP